jgi:hypothetical protein
MGGVVEYFVLALKGTLERAYFLYKAQYISTVKFTGYSSFMFYV